jgi:hypothetical protein
MAKCSIRQRPSLSMRRRLGMSVERGWLLRLHCSDCSSIFGTVADLDDACLSCVLLDPTALCSERQVDLDEVCEVEVLSTVMMQGSRLQARFAVIAAWRGGSADDSAIIADLLAGTVVVGDQGMVLLSTGVRRIGTFTGMRGRFWHLALAAPA